MTLTPRQAQIALLVAGGHSQKQIADMTGLSIGTIGVHVSRIAARIGGNGKASVLITRYVMEARMEIPIPAPA